MQKADWRKTILRLYIPQDRFLEGEDLNRFKEALAEEKESAPAHFIKFLLLGDWAMSSATELLQLKWQEIDFEKGFLRICLHPNKKNVSVIFSTEMDEPTTSFLQGMNSRRKNECPLVFPAAPAKDLLKEVRSVLRRVSRRANLEGVGLKVLKRS